MKFILFFVFAPMVIKFALRMLASLFRGYRGPPHQANPTTFRIKVLDGDTIYTRPGDHAVRLYGIDAPEVSQPQGAAATDFLKSLTDGQEVDLYPVERDRYGRIIARLIRRADKLDINGAMVSNGYALAETRYTSDYLAHQKHAKKNRLGLWQHGVIESPIAHRLQQNN